MSASRVAWIGAVCAVAGWTLKAIVIGIAGGLDKSPAEGPLFMLGLVAALVGSAALGVALTAGRPLGLRVAGGAAGVVGLLLVALVGGSVAAAAQPDSDPSWVWGEVNLWVAAVVLLGAVWLAHSRRMVDAPMR